MKLDMTLRLRIATYFVAFLYANNEGVGRVEAGSCAVSKSTSDDGYADKYRGWYDVSGCGVSNDYCRWVGWCGSGGDPSKKVVHTCSNSRGDSKWSCRRAGTDETGTYDWMHKYGSTFSHPKGDHQGAMVGACAVSKSTSDDGYADKYRGWYDVSGCGISNDYCRWVGWCGSGGDPSKKVVHKCGNSRGDSWWSCRRAGTDETGTYDWMYKYGSTFSYPRADHQGALVYGLQPSCHVVDESKYNICLDITSTSGAYEEWMGELMGAYAEAQRFWENIIVGDLPGTVEPTSGMYDSLVGTAYPDVIDDLYINAKSSYVDGQGGFVGAAQAGGVYLGGSFNQRTLEPYVVASAGWVLIDSADIKSFAKETLVDIIKHEMGHVIGVGSLWSFNGLYENGSDVYQDDTNAKREWNTIGCTGDLPVELDGEEGTPYGHWDEECLGSELMTGVSTGEGDHPLSKITIGSLEDMGYQVDYSRADAFTLNDLNGNACGNYCLAAQRRHLRSSGESYNNKKKVLSEEGEAKMKDYATKKLDKDNNDNTSTRKLEGDKVNHIGGDAIVVLYMEDEEIFSRTFTKKDL